MNDAPALRAASIGVAMDRSGTDVVTNGVQAIALAFEPAEGDELRRPPRSPSWEILSRTLDEQPQGAHP